MGGKIGAVGRFLVGPWGIALTVGALVLAPFVEKLFDAGKAADEAKEAADALSDAQGALSKVFDLVTGKLKEQNEVLRLNARLMAIKLRAEALTKGQSSAETFSRATQTDFLGGRVGGISDALGRGIPLGSAVGIGLLAGGEKGRRNAEQARLALENVRNGSLSREDALKFSAGMDFTGTKITRAQFQQAIIDEASSEANLKIADLIEQSLDDNKLADGLKKDAKAKKAKQPKEDRRTPAEIETIADITSQFDDAPALIDRAADAMRKLDAIIADVSKRKPIGFKEIIADAERAKDVVQAGLIKPYRDYIEGQQKALDVQRLINQGRGDEAEALQIIQRLESQMGPLTQARKDAILATVQALKAEQRETEIAREKAQSYLNALNDIKGAIRSVLTDGAKGIADLPKRLIASFNNLRADIIMEKLFGEAFRDLQDRASGVSIVKDASQKMATSIEGTLNPLANLASSATAAAQSLGKVGPAGTPTSADDPLGIGKTIADALAQETAGKPQFPGTDTGVSTVTGPRIPRDPAGFFSYTIEKLSKGVLGDEAAKKIGQFAGKGIEGAATGALVNSFVAPLGKALGVKTSNTGAQIGGAIGSFIPIPGGDIIGSVIGSVVGGLFKKTPRASATITSVDGDVSARGTSGQLRQQASALGGSVQSSLAQIAEALGGEVGGFSVSIGQRDGKFRVDPSGRGITKTKKGALDFGTDEQAAISAAVRDAITDGAVTGLSAAVQQAIRSSTNIDKALKEALKVQQVEELIGGIGSTLQRTFRDFDKEAADRVRIAKQYGLDVVKIEQINAEQRAQLVDDALKARVGSLKDFLDSVQFGDLSEGTVSEKRDKLLAQRAQLEQDALAGKDGAADKLAQVSAQLIQLTREGFGTAGGELASDRATSISGVERVIQMENDRVAQAAAQQQATTDAVQQNNTLTNETNNLLAQMNTNLGNLLGVAFGSQSGGRQSFVTERNTALA